MHCCELVSLVLGSLWEYRVCLVAPDMHQHQVGIYIDLDWGCWQLVCFLVYRHACLSDSVKLSLYLELHLHFYLQSKCTLLAAYLGCICCPGL